MQYNNKAPIRASSSVGQSNRLITGRSGVRVPAGPPAASCRPQLSGTCSDMPNFIPRCCGSDLSPNAPPKNRQATTCRFFIHCESNGISSALWAGSHHRRCLSSAVGCILFRNDDIQGFRLGDIQNFVLMIYTPFGVMWRTSSSPYENSPKYLFCPLFT